MDTIVLENLEKIYYTKNCETKALNGINLIIKENDLISIMGPSGSGKSTLMNIIGLIDTPSMGKYTLCGEDVSKINDKKASLLRNKKIGFIYQHFALINELNILENVMLPLNIRKLSRSIKKEKALKYLRKVGLEDIHKKYPYELSGGQQQRVAIARALAQESDIILADEPTGNLDEKNSEEIMKILVDLNKNNKTIIIITHDEKIAAYCHKKLLIIDGKIKHINKIPI